MRQAGNLNPIFFMNRDFKGVWIPKDIWVDKDLTWMEKLLLVEINSLDNSEGCYASNQYFAEFFNLSASRISEIVSSLVDKNYITSKLIYDGLQVKMRILKTSKVFGKPKGGIRKTEGGYSEKAQDNNTILNNTYIYKDNLDNLLIPYKELLGNNYQDFLDYWAEPNAKGKLRYQCEKFFDIKRRINTWNKNTNRYGNSKAPKSSTTSQQRMDNLKQWVNS
jgi:hypothetical protein